MSTDVTNRFLNQDKRYEEAVVMTVPAILKEGGGRANVLPTYLQGGESVKASVVEADTIIPKAYLIVDEAFPALAVLAVDIAGTAYFTGADLTVAGITVSAIEDKHFVNKQTIVATVGGVTGDIMQGKYRIVLSTIHPSLNNGQYAN